MALGQGINDLLKYADIAKAGAPQNLTGDALVGLGALFSQMDFNIPKKEDEKTLDEIDREKAKQKLKLDTAKLEVTPTLLEGKKHDFKTPNPKKVAPPPPKVVIDPDPVFEAQKDVVIPTVQSRTVSPTLVTGMTEGVEGYSLDFDYTTGKPMDGMQNAAQLAQPGSAMYVPGVSGKGVDLSEFSDVYNEDGTLKTASLSPINRLKSENPEIFKALESLRYTRRGDDDSPLFRAAHVASSPFLKTDGIDYRQMRKATMPSYAGQIGKAAAEGYNLVIDKYNYDQAVKADYDEELEDQMGSLDVEADFVGAESRKKYLEVSMQKKQELNSAFNDYANGKISKLEYENIKLKLSSDVNNIAEATNNLAAIRKDFLDNKGTFDVDASDSEMVDFYNTLEKAPDNLSVSNIDGVDYITGETRGGKAIKVPASKIANGTAGFRLVPKANMSPIISGAVKDINTFGQRTVKTEFGYGTASATPEKAREIGIASLKNKLSANESDLRSVMAQIYGVDHNLYQAFIGEDSDANRKQMIEDAAEHLYDTQVKGLVFEQEKTTKFVTPETAKKRGGGSSQTERLRAEFSKAWNKAPLPTKANIVNQYQNLIDTKRFRIVENKKGQVGIVDAKTGKGIPGSAIDFNQTPQQIKNQLLQYSKYQLYNTGSQTNLTEAQVQERAAQLLSNAGIN